MYRIFNNPIYIYELVVFVTHCRRIELRAILEMKISGLRFRHFSAPTSQSYNAITIDHLVVAVEWCHVQMFGKLCKWSSITRFICLYTCGQIAMAHVVHNSQWRRICAHWIIRLGQVRLLKKLKCTLCKMWNFDHYFHRRRWQKSGATKCLVFPQFDHQIRKHDHDQ